MSQRAKLLDRWRTNTPVDAPREQVGGILEYFFPGQYTWQTGGSSHYIVRDERLKNMKECGPGGEFSIPVRSGKRVIRVYLKRLVEVIDFIEQRVNHEDT
ncbi:MAG: hypothetical protein RDU30_07590 [Desulfovibrionaceae bacterium]|nr:hypothetical protein [Desulfovibrionaceae bacterium]